MRDAHASVSTGTGAPFCLSLFSPGRLLTCVLCRMTKLVAYLVVGWAAGELLLR